MSDIKPCPWCNGERHTTVCPHGTAATLTVADAMQVPEVLALVEYCCGLAHADTLDRLLAPFLAAMEGK